MKSDRIELPADKELVEKFIRDSTKEESDHFVYVLECDGWIEEKARRRAKDLHPPKTKEDLREYQKENNFENWRTFSERKKKEVFGT